MEMLIATGIMMTVTGAVFTLMNPTQGTYKAQPEVSDMQQRMRVGVDMLTKDLIMAGAGTYMGTSAGALYNYFSPIMPYRVGDLNPDPAANVFYRTDTISLIVRAADRRADGRRQGSRQRQQSGTGRPTAVELRHRQARRSSADSIATRRCAR